MKTCKYILSVGVVMILLSGCSINLNRPKQPLQSVVEQAISSTNLAKELQGKIPSGSKIVLRSLEHESTEDLPMIAIIEDQLIQDLMAQGYTVLERDKNTIPKMIKEDLEEKYVRQIGVNNVKANKAIEAADYQISYRILKCTLFYEPKVGLYDLTHQRSSTWLEYNRVCDIELHIRVIDTKTGRIITAKNITGRKTDVVKYDRDQRHYAYELFPFEIQPGFANITIDRWLAEGIDKNKKLSIGNLEPDSLYSMPLYSTIEDLLVVFLVSKGYALYERNPNAIQQLVREPRDGSYIYHLPEDTTHLDKTDYSLSFRIQEVNVTNEPKIGTLEIYRHGLLAMHVRIEDNTNGRIIKANDFVGTYSYLLDSSIDKRMNDYRYIKFAPSNYPLDTKGRLFTERIKRSDLENRKNVLLRPMLSYVVTNGQGIIGTELDLGVNLFRHSEAYLGAMLAGIGTDYGYSFHGFKIGHVYRKKSVSFNPIVGYGIAEATYVVYDGYDFPIGQKTDQNWGINYGAFLEYHILSHAVDLGYQGIWTGNSKTDCYMISVGFRF